MNRQRIRHSFGEPNELDLAFRDFKDCNTYISFFESKKVLIFNFIRIKIFGGKTIFSKFLFH